MSEVEGAPDCSVRSGGLESLVLQLGGGGYNGRKSRWPEALRVFTAEQR